MTRLLGVILCAAALCSAAPLYDALAAARFLHVGLVNATDTYFRLPVNCAYLEPENVSFAPAQGIGWDEGGACPYLYAANGPAPSPSPHACNSTVDVGMDRPGGDYGTTQAPQDAPACAAACCADSRCVAWAFAPAAPAGQEPSCVSGKPCCYLKASVVPEVPTPGVDSGVLPPGPPPPPAVTPPYGMRSAVPLGGVGAGAFELRADGTFHEVTIQNGSPAGAAKFGVLEDALLGVRVGGVARALRTAPPPFAAGVDQIAYSGAYPLSRLAASAADLPFGVTLYAYSKLVPGDPAASAAPAVAFTLALSNPTDVPVNVSLMFALPLAAVNDCARTTKAPLGNATAAAGYADCLSACAATAGCASWTYSSGPAGNGTCVLAADVPLSVFALGSYCGLQGGWSAGGETLELELPCNGAAATSPACGGAALQATSGVDGGTASSLGVANDPAALWRAFAATGAFPVGDGVLASGSFFNVSAAIGAAATTVAVPAGGNVTLSLVFAWFFPHRDYAGEDIGNYYSTLWESAPDVAAGLAADGALAAAAADLNAHHAVFANANSSLPDWLADHFVNQMSHMRGMIWSRDGRMREFEAFDCMDLDAIHIDYQRHLPYLWLMPQFETQKLRKWASGQVLPAGYIQEFLGPFGVGPFDVPGGRIMGDTTTLWIVELLELYRHTGDESLLADLWPTAARALAWAVNNTAGAGGLPFELYCTYDILWMNEYPTTAYNSFVYMAMLRAAEELAAVVGDSASAATASTALAAAQAALQAQLWNSTEQFFRAYTTAVGGPGSDNAVMSDSLYGQVIASYLGLGWLAPPAQLAAHLAAEERHNANSFGFTVVTNRTTLPPGGQVPDDDTTWQQGGPDWSTVAVWLLGGGGNTSESGGSGGSNLTAALAPARRSLENWRSRLHDLWDLCGLTSTDSPPAAAARGMPYITSHYGYLLVDFFMLPALAGQATDVAAGTLSFAPAVPCPFNLPALLAGVTGTVSCDAATGAYTLSIAFGHLVLPAGGLAVNGRAYPGAVDLAGGDSVTW